MQMPYRLTPRQIRGARAMLDWSILELARASGLSISTIKRMEHPEPQPVSSAPYAIVRAALEEAGVHFEIRDGYGEGVWLRQDQQRSHAR